MKSRETLAEYMFSLPFCATLR